MSWNHTSFRLPGPPGTPQSHAMHFLPQAKQFSNLLPSIQQELWCVSFPRFWNVTMQIVKASNNLPNSQFPRHTPTPCYAFSPSGKTVFKPPSLNTARTLMCIFSSFLKRHYANKASNNLPTSQSPRHTPTPWYAFSASDKRVFKPPSLNTARTSDHVWGKVSNW